MLSSSENISQSSAEGDAAAENDQVCKLAGAEELFVLFGRLRFKRLRAGLMNVACNRKESGFWPFSTWCLAGSSGDEEGVDERSSGSSVCSAGSRDVSDAIFSSYVEISDAERRRLRRRR